MKNFGVLGAIALACTSVAASAEPVRAVRATPVVDSVKPVRAVQAIPAAAKAVDGAKVVRSSAPAKNESELVGLGLLPLLIGAAAITAVAVAVSGGDSNG